jgi:phosphoglucosamine mutase
MSRLFGTDGVRGLANRDVTARLALQLAVAGSRVLARPEDSAAGKRPVAIVGRDTRVSGEFLAASMSAGIASTGVDVDDVGVLPTPGIAYAVKATGATFGVVISASHNPMPDNGIKFFGPGGTKLTDAQEDEILALLDEEWERPTGADVGRISRYPAAADEFTEHLVRGLGEPGAARPLSGLEVVVIAAEPDGYNINDGVGSTHIDNLREAVVHHQADLGVAFDGDADRCLAVDSLGREVDGDQVMGVLALGMKEEGTLADDTLVVTVMSNLGLRLAMEKQGIRIEETAVGDRYVLERMLEGSYSLGGEQSGHVLLLEHGTTGDGVQTALHLMHRMARTGRTLADLAAEVPKLPQVLINVKGVDKARVGSDEGLQQDISAVEAELGETGRVLLRASGTEPVIRVMVEAATEDEAQAQAQRLADSVQERLAL